MRIAFALSVWTLGLCPVAAASAQEGKPGTAVEKTAAAEASSGAKLGPPQVVRWRVGMIVTAVGSPCGHLMGTMTVPMDWPEQQVKIVGQDFSPGVAVSYKNLRNLARQMVISFPALAAGKEGRGIVIFELARRSLGPPESPGSYVMPDPKKLPGNLKGFLEPSPYIESSHPRIKEVAEQIAADRPKAWDRAKAACDWARRTIQYKKDAPLTGVLKAMETGTGDCNQLTSAFIAVCRAGGIPARTVRIPGHCYPEFYLADARGEGHWFATEAASDEAFGIVHGDAPILQKGDNFPLTAPDQANPRKRIEKPFRFLPESLVGTPKRGGVEPQMKLVCEPAQE